MIFELGWQSKAYINENSRLWVQHAIETSTNMFRIFKWELLDGIELAVQPSPAFIKVFKDSFLDIDICPLSFLNKWEKQEVMFTPQQQNLHKVKVNQDQGQMSKASTNNKETISADAKGKGKGKVEESTFQDIYADAQDLHDINWDKEYSKMVEYNYLKMLE